MGSLLLMAMIMYIGSSFNIQLNCTYFNDYLLDQYHVIVYSKYSTVRDLLNNVSAYADPFTSVLLCSHEEALRYINITQDILPAYVFYQKTIKVVPNFTLEDFLNFDKLSPLVKLPDKENTTNPFVCLILRMPQDTDIYQEFEGLALKRIFNFTGFYYVDVSNSSEDIEERLASRETPVIVISDYKGTLTMHKALRTENDSVEIVKMFEPYYTEEAKKHIKLLENRTTEKELPTFMDSTYIRYIIIAGIVMVVIIGIARRRKTSRPKTQ